MHSVVSKLLVLLAALNLSSAAPAQLYVPEKGDQLIEVCRTNLIKFKEGDKEWLARAARFLPKNDQAWVQYACSAYAQGFLDGIQIMDMVHNMPVEEAPVNAM